MKHSTETAIRSIIAMDGEIDKETAERALDALRGKTSTEDALIHTIRFKDAAELLQVSNRMLRYYLDNGYLDRVFGCGKRAIGLTRESLLRFMTRRMVRHEQKGGRVSQTYGSSGMKPTLPQNKERKIG